MRISTMNDERSYLRPNSETDPGRVDWPFDRPSEVVGVTKEGGRQIRHYLFGRVRSDLLV